jgi:twitching motility protein PilT
MALFPRTGNPLPRLKEREWKNETERTELFQEILELKVIKPREILWTLSAPELELRNLGAQMLPRFTGPLLVEALLEETQGKSDIQLRALARLLSHCTAADRLALVAKLLVDKNPKRRMIATDVLATLSVPESLPVLLRLVKDTLPQMQLFALQRIAEAPTAMEGRAFRASVLQLAEHGASDELRIAAMTLLIRYKDQTPETQAVIVQAMKDRNPALQDLATQYFGPRLAAGNAELESSLVELLPDGRPEVRSAVIKALLYCPDRKRVLHSYLSFARNLAGWVRERTLASLQPFSADILDPILELMEDPDERIRMLAMLVGGALGNARCVPPIIKMLHASDWWTRITAAELLGKMADKRAVPALLELLKDKDAHWAAVEALGRIKDPSAMPALAHLLDDPQEDLRMSVVEAMAGFGPTARPYLEAVQQKDGSPRVRQRAHEAMEDLANPDGSRERTSAAGPAAHVRATGELDQMLVEARQQGASDLHLSVGVPPAMRVHGNLAPLNKPPLQDTDAERLVFSALTDAQKQQLTENMQLDLCYTIKDVGRHRVNIFRERMGWSAVFRLIAAEVPTLAALGLPKHVADVVGHHQGLVVVAGASGSGKSTTLAALVNVINERIRGHILTIEDPVEFIHEMKNCLMNQREIGKHTQSFANALRGALRENPDVIVVGDLRDPETTRIALEAAETGHLVVTTMNTTTAAKTVDRLVESFPPEEQAQVRTSLAESLKGVLCQSLIPHKTLPKRVACVEVLLSSASVRALIRDGKTFQLGNSMTIGHAVGMRTQDAALLELVKADAITGEAAYLRAQKKEAFEPFVSAEFLAENGVEPAAKPAAPVPGAPNAPPGAPPGPARPGAPTSSNPAFQVHPATAKGTKRGNEPGEES